MRWLFYFICVLSFASCKVYNQNILFKTKKNIINNKDTISAKIQKAERNYVIQPNDYIEVRIFTANGQALLQPVTPIDPNSPAGNMQPMMGGGMQQGMGMQQGGAGGSVGGGNPFPLEMPIFHVRQDGNVHLPVVGDINLLGLTLHQVDSTLKARYSAEKLYQDCYVRTRYMNKRITIFSGGTAIIFPLRNEKILLTEIIASVGGMHKDLRGSNIRLIRGDLLNPNVYIINFRSVESMQASIANMHPYYNLVVEPNDIVYIEPIRKTFWEAFSDVAAPISTITGTVTTILALILILRQKP